MQPIVCRTAAVATVLATAPAAAQTTAETHFQQGVAAYKAAAYRQAVEHFEAARAAGLTSPALLQNLGASYYRLQRYAKAEAIFTELARDPANRGIAQYNLGLIELARAHPDPARRHFRKARDATDNDRIRRLAERQLTGLGGDEPPDRFSGLLSASLGYNDNVTLAPDDTVSGTDADRFLEYMAAATYQARGDRRDGLQVKGSVLGTDYTDIDRFDQTYVRVGPEWDRRWGRWDTDLAAHADFLYLDGSLFESVLTGEAEGRRELGPSTSLRLRYRFSRIEGDAPYGYLTGNRHRASVEGRYRDGFEAEAGYELEYNDRNDRTTATRFTSVSPTRHKVFLEAAYPAGPWEAEAEAEYRYSRYHDANTDTRTGLNRVREDDRLTLEAGLSRKLPWALRSFAEYRHTDNDSNIGYYAYTANVVQLGLERYF
ncbi:MAG: hypothetical protein ABEJ96_04640 [Thiohalorhabdaceae bacterium]